MLEENIFSALKGRLNNAGVDICCSKNLLYENARWKKYFYYPLEAMS